MEFNKYIGIYPTSGAVQSAIDEGLLHKPYIAIVQDGNYIDWNSKGVGPEYSAMPLTFEVLSGGTIRWTRTGGSSVNVKTIQYNKNGGAWTTITSNTGESAPSISVDAGDIVQFKGENTQYYVLSTQNAFKSSALIKVYGNIFSLFYGDNFLDKTEFPKTASSQALREIFKECIGLTDASNLVLPATALTQGCYRGMFQGCTSLTTAPELPATTLTIECYHSMFTNCSNLNYIKCLATNISAKDCTSGWVNGVVTTGTFVKNPNMTSWGRGPNGTPINWTVIDADL